MALQRDMLVNLGCMAAVALFVMVYVHNISMQVLDAAKLAQAAAADVLVVAREAHTSFNTMTGSLSSMSSSIKALHQRVERANTAASNPGGALAAISAAAVSQPSSSSSCEGNPMKVVADADNLFKQIADKHVTDKTTVHRYHPIYEKYFRYQRENPELRVLEIGLGCNMQYGPGHSIPVWKEYFPKMQAFYMLEYNGGCAANFKDKVTEMFVGDQADMALTESIGKKTQPLDILVDDGGHSMRQQRNSIISLFKYVRPGGVYFIEDLHGSFEQSPGQDNGAETTAKFIADIMGVMHDVNKGSQHPADAVALAAMIEYVECWREVCAFVRKL